MGNVLLGTLQRVGELKRLPGTSGSSSLAESLFVKVAGRIIASESDEQISEIFGRLVLEALASSVLGHWQPAFVSMLSLRQRRSIFDRAVLYALEACTDPIRRYLEQRLSGHQLPLADNPLVADVASTRWVARLCEIRRAGYSCLKRPKCIPFPWESQADHSLICAVYAALIACDRSSELVQPCLMALFHHLPMALAPDVDHEMEHLLGADEKHNLEQIALGVIFADFPDAARTRIANAIQAYKGEGMNFARSLALEADILDRAMQISYYERMSALTLRTGVDEYELLTPGPLRDFQARILKDYGLI